MVSMRYLHNNGRVVKKFVARASSSGGLKAISGLIINNMYKLGGILIFERKVSETGIFYIISFEDEINMAAWESITRSAMKDATIVNIISSKVLHIVDDNGDDTEAMKKMEEIKASVNKYAAVILREDKLDDAKYELLLFFTDEKQMKEWESAFGIQGI